MTVAVQLYSVREAFAADPVGTFERLRDLGVGQVELFDLDVHEASFAECLRVSGLVARSGHAPLLTAADPLALLDAAVRLGVTTVVEPAVLDGWGDAAGVAAIAARLGALVPEAATTTTGGSSRRSTGVPRSRPSPPSSTRRSCSRSTSTGRRSRACGRRACSSVSAPGSPSCT